MRELSTELQKIAEKELNENKKRLAEDLKHIKDWIAKQPHLNARTDDQWLLSFLRGCKFSLERTKEKLDFHYTVRGLCPDLFGNRDPFQPEIQKILSMGTFLPLPNLLPNFQKTILLKHKYHKNNNIKLSDLFKTNLMIMDILLMEDDPYTIAGSVVIQDLEEIDLAFYVKSPIEIIKKFMTITQNGYPSRSKQLYFINTPSFFDQIFTIFKAFLSEKNKSRMKLYTPKEIENFHSDYSKSYLPTEYGGDAGSLEELTAFWKKKVESYRDWFIEDGKYGTNEKKRVGKPKTTSEIFGIEGSFRKLDID